MQCKRGYEVKVLRSAAGYYIGTFDEEEGPNCRISGYYASQEAAAEALGSKNVYLRDAIENCCNGEFVNWGSE